MFLRYSMKGAKVDKNEQFLSKVQNHGFSNFDF